jgi:hypothetical protein
MEGEATGFGVSVWRVRLLCWNLCMEGQATVLESVYGGLGYCVGISVWRVRLLCWNLCMEGQATVLESLYGGSGYCVGISYQAPVLESL